jgi:hypothetical protein
MASTFTQTVDQIVAHRVQNSRFNLPTDWSVVAAELDAFTCARLRNDPSWCTTAQKKTSYKTVPFIQSQFAKVVGLVESVGKKFKGSQILKDWLGDGGLPVSPDIANRRALVCSQCPMNEKGNWVDKVSAGVAEVIKSQREIKTGLTLKVEKEEELGTCSGCGCHLPLKVWVPIKVMKEYTTEEEAKSLHPDCWFHVEHFKELMVVMPFCRHDAKLAKTVLEWIIELGGQPNHKILLVADIKVDKEVQNELVMVARKAFKSVELITTPYSLRNEAWPLGPNWMFETALKHVYEHYMQPFFFMEPDVTPLKSGWLDKLEEEYNLCGKPFMGRIVSSTGRSDLPGDHLTGVACYPPDAYVRFKHIFGQPTAFDMLTSETAVPETHDSELLQHFWGQLDLAPVFRADKSPDNPKNTLLLRNISPKAVTFHRSKTDSLIKLLRTTR